MMYVIVIVCYSNLVMETGCKTPASRNVQPVATKQTRVISDNSN